MLICHEPCTHTQESKAAADMTQRIMADVQRSNNEVATLNAYLQVGLVCV